MRDIDIISKAMENAHAVLCAYIEPGPRHAEEALHLMLEILDNEDVVAARERLSKGYERLQIVRKPNPQDRQSQVAHLFVLVIKSSFSFSERGRDYDRSNVNIDKHLL